jgi:hypothetical protein
MSEVLSFSAQADPSGVPAPAYHWDFGDGTTAEGPTVEHAYTRPGSFVVQLVVQGLDGLEWRRQFAVEAAGTLTAAPDVLQNRRYMERPNP